ncbi:MAG: peptidylprolyl isomerase [Actinobacteria bacterium]|nr:peptidylprolyl isomerase [Actinomycetota bacterium]
MSKRTVITLVASLFVLLLTSPIAQAADSSQLKCSTPTATVHSPMKVAQPTKKAKALPKTMIITTNCGKIVISLLGSKAPITVTSLSALARAKYFDKSFCHRLTTAETGISVLQCGDPTAKGSGSPTGWKPYKDENLPPVGPNNYPAGTLAMANSGPNTNGSQFFFVYSDTSFPQPNYTIWGKVTSGLGILTAIAEKKAYEIKSDGKAYYVADGLPVQTVSIEKVSFK